MAFRRLAKSHRRRVRSYSVEPRRGGRARLSDVDLAGALRAVICSPYASLHFSRPRSCSTGEEAMPRFNVAP